MIPQFAIFILGRGGSSIFDENTSKNDLFEFWNEKSIKCINKLKIILNFFFVFGF